MSASKDRAILTLEPLVDAVRDGIEGGGWTLSGLQKTTSHQFEGRWEGESTRSAYLFFHVRDRDAVSIDVYLDETSRGLAGNLALVVDLVSLAELGDPEEVLRVLGDLAKSCLPRGYATPMTLRLRLQDGGHDPRAAECEIRFKLRIPERSIAAGRDAVRDLATVTVTAFEDILSAPELAPYVSLD